MHSTPHHITARSIQSIDPGPGCSLDISLTPIRNDKLEAVSEYLKQGKTDARDTEDNTLLHLSAKHGASHIVKCIMENENECPVNEANQFGDTPLLCTLRERYFHEANCGRPCVPYRPHFCKKKKYYDTIEMLIGHGARASVKNKSGESALRFCRRFHDKDVVRLLSRAMQSENVSVDEMAKLFLDSECPLYCAVFSNNPELLQRVCEVRRNVDCPDEFGYTALLAAINDGNIEMIKILKEFGSDLKNVKAPNGLSMLHMAAQLHGSDMITDEDRYKYQLTLKFLLENGAAVNTISSRFKETPLHLAVLSGNRPAVEMLVDYGANVTIPDNENNNVLHFAAENDQDDILQLLADTGKLDVNAKNSRGNTPLHIAVERRKLPHVRCLLSRGANANIENSSGWNSLYLLINSCRERRFVGLKESMKEEEEEKKKEEELLSSLLKLGKADANKLNPSKESIMSDVPEISWKKIIIHHLVMLEQVHNTPISKENIKCIESSRLTQYLNECRREFTAMNE